MNVSDAVSDYLLDQMHLDKGTVQGYSHRLTTFASWCEENGVELEQVNNRQVQSFLQWLRENKKPQKKGQEQLSSFTTAGYTLCIKIFLTWCQKDEEYSSYTSLARVKGIKYPRKVQMLKHIFTDEEIHTLMDAAKHQSKTHEYQLRDTAIVSLLLDTGIRASELRSLTIGNTNLARMPGEDSFIKVMGKGRKEREVPVGHTTRRNLSRYLRQYRAHAPRNAPVFVSRQGKGVLSHQGLKDVLLRIKEVSGLPADTPVHPHKFRHTFATRFMQNGGDVYTLSRLLGHSSVAITEHYLTSLGVNTGRMRSRMMDYSSIVDSL